MFNLVKKHKIIKFLNKEIYYYNCRTNRNVKYLNLFQITIDKRIIVNDYQFENFLNYVLAYYITMEVYHSNENSSEWKAEFKETCTVLGVIENKNQVRIIDIK